MEHDEVFKFVPVYAQACDPKQLSLFLPQTQYVNFERDYDAGFAALCRALGVAPPSKPQRTPPTPLPPDDPKPPERPTPSSTPSRLEQAFYAALDSKNWAEAQRRLTYWQAIDPDDPALPAAQTRLHTERRADEAHARAAQLSESREGIEAAVADDNWEDAARHAAIVLQLEPDNARAGRILKLAQTELARLQPKLLTLAPGITLEMVHIKTGDFLYGEDEQKLTLPEFWMGKTPVTVAQYWAFLQATKHPRNGYWKWGEAKRKPYLNHPAVDVDWADANAFCAWASQVTQAQIRLPSEREWEKAARGSDGREYPWGPEAPDDTRCNFNKGWDSHNYEANYAKTTPVGSFSPKGDSPYKLQDMAGNVWEWCADWYDSSNQARVVRGGAFGNYGDGVRCAFRNYYVPADRISYIGFRVSASHLSHL
jgi:serine/threonine-protein kinase